MKAQFIFLIFLFIISCKTTTKTTTKPVIDNIIKTTTKETRENKIAVIESQSARIKQEVQGAKVEIRGDGVAVIFDESVNDDNFLLFPAGSSALSSKGKESLNSLVRIFHDFPNTYIKIESYTDDVGPAADNMVLSQRQIGRAHV